MKRISIFIFSFLLNSCDQSPVPPNIIYILADDLGYGELGVYGQKIIETPNIDVLAKNGMLFTQHYSGSPVCAPSRSVFMTGQHTGHTHPFEEMTNGKSVAILGTTRPCLTILTWKVRGRYRIVLSRLQNY